MVLPLMMILLSLQTKMGEKVAIIYDRALDYISGHQQQQRAKHSHSGNKRKESYTDVSNGSRIADNPANLALNEGGVTSLSALPTYDHPKQTKNSGGQQQNEYSDVMAANEVLGGGGFGTSF